MPSVEVSDVLVRVKPPFCSSVTVSPVAVSVSDPLPVQPLTVNVLPALVAVRLAVVNAAQAKRHAVGRGQRGVGQRVAGALARRHRVGDAAAVGQRSAARPAADREGVAAGCVGQVGGREPAQGQRSARPVTASDVLVNVTLAGHAVNQGLRRALERSAPVQPVTVKVLPPLLLVGEVGGRDSAQAQRRVGGRQLAVGQRERAARPSRSRMPCARRGGQRSGSRPAADREGIARSH